MSCCHLGGNKESCLLLPLEALFCSIHLKYEDLIFSKSPSSVIYTQSIRSKEEPHSTVEKCAVIIIDIVKIEKVKLNCKDAGFVDI